MSSAVAKSSRGRPPKKSYKEVDGSEPAVVEDEVEQEEETDMDAVNDKSGDEVDDEHEDSEYGEVEGKDNDDDFDPTKKSPVRKAGSGRPPGSAKKSNSPTKKKSAGRGRPKGSTKKSENDMDDDNEDLENGEVEEKSPPKSRNARVNKSDVTYNDDSDSEEEENLSEEEDEDSEEENKSAKNNSSKKVGRGRPSGSAKNKTENRGRPPKDSTLGSVREQIEKGVIEAPTTGTGRKGRPPGSTKKSEGKGRPQGGGEPKKDKTSPIRYLLEFSDSSGSEIDAGEQSDDEGDMNYRPYGDIRVKKRKKVTKESDSESDGGGVWKPGKSLPGEKKYVRKEKKEKTKKKPKLNEDGTVQKEHRGRPPKDSTLGSVREQIEKGIIEAPSTTGTGRTGRPPKDSTLGSVREQNEKGVFEAPSTTPKKRGQHPKKISNKSEDIAEEEQAQEVNEKDGVTEDDVVSEEDGVTQEEE